jgi:hypothetical protein
VACRITPVLADFDPPPIGRVVPDDATPSFWTGHPSNIVLLRTEIHRNRSQVSKSVGQPETQAGNVP